MMAKTFTSGFSFFVGGLLPLTTLICVGLNHKRIGHPVKMGQVKV